MPSSRLYQKQPGGTWYAWYYVNDRRLRRCTKKTDKRAALKVLRRWEREVEGGAPSDTPPHSLSEALNYLVDFGCQGKSEWTKRMYSFRGSQLVRLLGEHLD